MFSVLKTFFWKTHNFLIHNLKNTISDFIFYLFIIFIKNIHFYCGRITFLNLFSDFSFYQNIRTQLLLTTHIMLLWAPKEFEYWILSSFLHRFLFPRHLNGKIESIDSCFSYSNNVVFNATRCDGMRSRVLRNY